MRIRSPRSLAALLPLLGFALPLQAASDAEQQARKAYLDGNYPAVKESCQAAADAGDIGCLEVIGRTLLAAKNPERDVKAGVQLLQKAVDGGSTLAMNFLAFEHYSGATLEPSAELAFSWWNKAAQAGYIAAYGHMGPLYRDGRLVPRDLPKAREMFEKSADDNSRTHLAGMLFYGEGGDRQVDRAFALWTEASQSKTASVAKRAQAELDKARKVAANDRADVALYFNPFHPDVRRNLEGKWVLKDMATVRQMQVCWPDAAYAPLSGDATALLPGYDSRAVAQLQKQLNDAKVTGATLVLSHSGNCLKTAPLVVLTRQANPTLAATGPVSLDGQARESQQLATAAFATLVLESTLEARDKSSESFNEAFADKATRWQLGEAASAGKPLYAVVSTAAAGASAAQAVCTLKGEVAPAEAVAALGDYWSRRKLNIATGKAAPTEYDSAEALFDAINAKGSPCPVVVAPVATAQKISQALARDKVNHKVYADAGWTATSLADADARAKGYADAAQKAFAAMLAASPEDIRRIIGAGLKQADDLKAAQKRATTTGYPTSLLSVDQVMRFLDDEAAGRKLKKSGAAVAKERLAADDAARKRQEADDAAARRKTELAAADQKKRDEADSNTDQLSERAGLVGPVACRAAADDHVSQVARFAHKWDDVGFTGVLFDRFLTKAPRPGVITLVSNHLAMQNGFGAYKRVKVLCEYDTRTKKTAMVDIVDGD